MTARISPMQSRWLEELTETGSCSHPTYGLTGKAKRYSGSYMASWAKMLNRLPQGSRVIWVPGNAQVGSGRMFFIPAGELSCTFTDRVCAFFRITL